MKRYVHDLSNYHMLDTFAQDIVPLNCVEMLPNTIVRGNSEALIRMSSPLRPFMHPLKVKVFHFFTPTRILWPGWEKFITQGAYGSTPPVHPYVTLDMSNTAEGSLANHLGISPLSGANTLNVSALPFAAYNRIMAEYFADQDLASAFIPALMNECVDGDNTGIIGDQIWKASWKKDYFTAARPWAQKSPAVPIPQSGIVMDPEILAGNYNGDGQLVRQYDGSLAPSTSSLFSDAGATSYLKGTGGVAGTSERLIDPNDTLVMDETASMRDLSLAGALQLFFENRAQYGSRLIEYLRGAFGSRISDSVLQNPQLVNYAEKTLKISEVLQTAPDATDPVGTLRGHGIGGLGTNTFTYNIKEHGWWMTLAYIMPEPGYMNSLEKFWLKRNFNDYFQKEFVPVGQQPIKNIEVNQYHTSPEGNFGFTDPYMDYKRTLNLVSGGFQNVTEDKKWHMFRELPVDVALNNDFVTGAPTDRIFASTTTPNYKIMNYNKLIVRSVVPRSVKKRIL